MHGSYIDPDRCEEKEGKYYDKHTGEELTSQIDKMSKSKLNGVSPDEIIAEYGADTLRLYEMFMGPLEKEKFGIRMLSVVVHVFLHRFYDMAVSDKFTDRRV